MCDSEIADLLDSDPRSWLEALPAWQSSDIRQLLDDRTRNLDEILEQLVSGSSAAGTVPFGGVTGLGLYKQKLEKEFFDFFCSPNRYVEERAEWKRQANISKVSAVAFLSSQFSETFNAAPPYLGAVVAVMLVTIGTMNLNAFCSMLETSFGQAASAQESGGDADSRGSI